MGPSLVRSSNSGKSTIFYKRLPLRRTKLRLLVSNRVFLLMRLLTNTESYRTYSDSKAIPNARTLIS